MMLLMLGSEVYGYALDEPTDPALFSILGLDKWIHSEIGDIRDMEKLKKALKEADPDIVFHLAAQPIVRTSYEIPRDTYEINVMGTVNLLECIRESMKKGGHILSVLNVTTDKVYENADMEEHAFCEEEKLDGFDPYSNSKSCSELVTHSYIKSFFQNGPSVSTARAGNVIGGGDFARDRIIPDCVRYTVRGEPIRVRNPYSTRPYQHVMEPLYAYLLIAMQQALVSEKAGSYNVGPEESDAVTTSRLADMFTAFWGGTARWESEAERNAPHEARFLKLNTEKLKAVFGWKPRFCAEQAVQETTAWYRAWSEDQDMKVFTEQQIEKFLGADI